MIKNRDIAWSALGNQGSQLLTFGISTVLARGLSASDFGLYALVQVVIVFGAIFSEGGIRVSVLQLRPGGPLGDRHFLAHALVVGVVASLMVAGLAPGLGLFFNEPQAVEALMVLSLSFAPSAASGVYLGILQREARFRELGMIGLGATLLAGAAAILAAKLGAGYWSLVLQGLVRPFVVCLLGFYRAGPALRPLWRWRDSLATLRVTGDLVAFEFVNFAHRNLDRVLIGRNLGSTVLGHYTRGYTLLLTFNQAVSGTLAPVFHSACARPNVQKADILHLYGVELSRALWIGAPFMAACASLASDVIRIVWGPNWADSVAIFKWLALAGIHQVAFGYFGSVFAVTRQTRRLLICSIITSSVFLGAIVLGLEAGIEAVARNYMVASWLVFGGVTLYVWRVLLGGAFGALLRRSLPPLASAVVVFWILRLGVSDPGGDHTGEIVASLLRVALGGVLLLPIYWSVRKTIFPTGAGAKK